MTRWFELDPAYQVMKVLQRLRMIDMSRAVLMPDPGLSPTPAIKG